MGYEDEIMYFPIYLHASIIGWIRHFTWHLLGTYLYLWMKSVDKTNTIQGIHEYIYDQFKIRFVQK